MPSTPFVPAENTAQVEFRYTQYSQQVENVIYVRREDENALSEANYEEILDVLYDNWVDNGQAYQSSSVVLRELFLTDLTTETSPTELLTINDSATGASGLASSVTYTTTFVTSGRGRNSRGRNYWIGLPAAEVTGNVVSSTIAAAILAYYNAMSIALATTTTGYRHVIVSRRLDNAWRETALVQNVTGYRQVDNIVDNQRRRLTGRGL